MKAKLELSGRNDKLDQAGVEVLEVFGLQFFNFDFKYFVSFYIFMLQWESKVMRGQEEFDNISRMIKKEVDYLESIRIKEFKDTVVKYLEDHMAHQQQVNFCSK